MNRVYKFVAGNSRVTPIGMVVAVVAALALRGNGIAASIAFLAVLIATLAASSFEQPV